MKLSRFDFWFLVFIFFLNLFLKIFRLDAPEAAYFDEFAYYIPAARDYLQGDFLANFEHPPLAKIGMSFGILVFGDNLWGWRIPEALVGSFGVVFVYLLGKEIFPAAITNVKNIGSFVEVRVIPILASIFLTFEFGWFIHSRIALLEVYVATFSLAAAWFFWKFFKEGSIKYLILSGVFFGLAAGSKWNGVFLLFFAVGFYLWSRRGEFAPAIRKMGILVFVTVVVYTATFSFYFTKNNPADFISLHKEMVTYHLVENTKRVEQKAGGDITLVNYQYAPWTWIFNGAYPYYSDEKEGKNSVIFFFYNPAIFWGALVAFLVGLKRHLKEEKIIFLVGSYLVFWLPWFLSPRVALPYFLLSAIPFGAILLAQIIKRQYSKRRFLVWGFLATVLLLFLFYYPIISALSVPSWYLKILTGGSI